MEALADAPVAVGVGVEVVVEVSDVVGTDERERISTIRASTCGVIWCGPEPGAVDWSTSPANPWVA